MSLKETDHTRNTQEKIGQQVDLMKKLIRQKEGKGSETDKDGYSKGENNGDRSNIWGLNYLRDVKLNSGSNNLHQGEKPAERPRETLRETRSPTFNGDDWLPDWLMDSVD